MLPFILNRTLSGAITLIIVGVAVFGVVHLLPGDPVAIMLGDQTGGDARVVAELRRQLSLDLPIWEQFVRWVSGVMTGEFGTSIRTGESVGAELARRIPRSIELIAAGLAIAIALGVPLGVIAARNRGKPTGVLVSIIAVLGFSTPSFVAGIVLVLLFSLWLPILPPSGYVAFSQDPVAHLAALILPALTIGLNFMGVITRMTRASLADALGKDYVRLARAKGLSRSKAIVSHALPNALVPVIAIIGIRAGNMLGGLVIVEALFDWPGVSSLLVSASFARDLPVMQATVIAIFAIFIVISIMIDIAQSVVDPRIQENPL